MDPTPKTLQIEIHEAGHWQLVGTIKLLDHERLGLSARSEFCYDLDYATRHIGAVDVHAVSCSMPVSFEPYEVDGWPPFLLDLFPQGAAMQYVVNHYRIPDREENYWRILATARLNPPGNLRVVVPSTDTKSAETTHAGFTRSEVVSKGADFLEYMIQCGAPVTGTTGAGGAAPKFLLREDRNHLFHGDGTLDDTATKACWLVKFPRGKKQVDLDILRSEAAILRIAGELGLYTFREPEWHVDCLFVPRFDRRFERNRIVYLGLESFYSLAGKADFGSRYEHETYLQALARYSSEPADDSIEYVLRDFFNVMVGNTDNHGRNTSVLKGDGFVRLGPLYDVAPMMFDPEGIVRNTRWGKETADGDPAAIFAFLSGLTAMNKETYRNRIKQFHAATINLAERLRHANVPNQFIAGTKTERDRQHLALTRFLETTR